jgi:hypothetical protein
MGRRKLDSFRRFYPIGPSKVSVPSEIGKFSYSRSGRPTHAHSPHTPASARPSCGCRRLACAPPPHPRTAGRHACCRVPTPGRPLPRHLGPVASPVDSARARPFPNIVDYRPTRLSLPWLAPGRPRLPPPLAAPPVDLTHEFFKIIFS